LTLVGREVLDVVEVQAFPWFLEVPPFPLVDKAKLEV